MQVVCLDRRRTGADGADHPGQEDDQHALDIGEGVLMLGPDDGGPTPQHQRHAQRGANCSNRVWSMTQLFAVIKCSNNLAEGMLHGLCTLKQHELRH